jgi:hypothetical protein
MWYQLFDTTGCGANGQIGYDPDVSNYVPPPSGKAGPDSAVGLRPKPGSKAVDSLHAFGDILPYEFNLTAPLCVRAYLTTSTYEGRCMNYPVNDGTTTEPDTISDLVPILDDGWTLVSQSFNGDRSRWLVERTLGQGFHDLNIKVLDYAAEGDLSAFRCDNSEYDLCCAQKIPRNYDYWKSQADPDSDGLTVWEEYRGFCNTDGSHFRLDLDTCAENTKRQIIIIDDDDVLERDNPTGLIHGFVTRLQEMMRCSLVVKDSIMTSPVDGHFLHNGQPCDWDFYERLDTCQAKWDETTSHWVPNQLSNPLYVLPAPADSNGLSRASDQVGVRLSICWDATADDYGETCHKRASNGDWPFGICGNAGTRFLPLYMENTILYWWPDGTGGSDFDVYESPELMDSVYKVCLRRTIAHEMGHVIDIPDHAPDQDSGIDLMCPLLNVMLRTPSELPLCTTDQWWDWWQEWRDIQSQENHKWRFLNEGNNQCSSSIRYRQ